MAMFFQQYQQLFAPWVQVILLLVAVYFAYLSYRQRQWKSAADAAIAEMRVWHDTAERLGKENRGLIAVNTALQCKTDLTPIVETINHWTNESRGHFLQAMQRLEVIHKEQVEAMREVTQNLRQLSRFNAKND
jgi:uncharacterized membrane protein YdbT with pleckstrin-like domain